MNIKINDDIKDKLMDYCKLNNLKISKFVNELLKKSLAIEKFGEKPPFFIEYNDLSLRDRVYGIGNDTIDKPFINNINNDESNAKQQNEVKTASTNIKNNNKRIL